MKKFIIKNNLTDSEYYKLTLYILFKAKFTKRLLRIVLIPVTIVIGLIVTSLGGNSHSNSSTLSVFLPILILPTLLLLVFILMPFLVIKFKKKNLSIYEWGMSMKMNDKTFNFNWNDLTYYTELSSAILITQGYNDINTHIISKKGFNSNEEIREFIDFLNFQRLKRK